MNVAYNKLEWHDIYVTPKIGRMLVLKLANSGSVYYYTLEHRKQWSNIAKALRIEKWAYDIEDKFDNDTKNFR